jgi:hypothetical protein
MRVGDWVESLAGAALQLRAATVARIEDAHAKVGSNDQEILHLLSTSGVPASSPAGAGPRPIERTTVRPNRPPDGPAEEVSSASMSGVAEASGLETPRRRSLRGWVAAGLGGLLLVLGIGSALSAQSRAHARGQMLAPSGAEAVSAPALSVATAGSPSLAVPSQATLELDRPSLPAVSVAREPEPAPASSVAVAAPPSVATTHHSHVAAAPPPPAPPKVASDCEVPYVIDAKGAKRFKPQCF